VPAWWSSCRTPNWRSSRARPDHRGQPEPGAGTTAQPGARRPPGRGGVHRRRGPAPRGRTR
jgi:hypothetical protein